MRCVNSLSASLRCLILAALALWQGTAAWKVLVRMSGPLSCPGLYSSRFWKVYKKSLELIVRATKLQAWRLSLQTGKQCIEFARPPFLFQRWNSDLVHGIIPGHKACGQNVARPHARMGSNALSDSQSTGSFLVSCNLTVWQTLGSSRRSSIWFDGNIARQCFRSRDVAGLMRSNWSKVDQREGADAAISLTSYTSDSEEEDKDQVFRWLHLLAIELEGLEGNVISYAFQDHIGFWVTIRYHRNAARWHGNIAACLYSYMRLYGYTHICLQLNVWCTRGIVKARPGSHGH